MFAADIILCSASALVYVQYYTVLSPPRKDLPTPFLLAIPGPVPSSPVHTNLIQPNLQASDALLAFLLSCPSLDSLHQKQQEHRLQRRACIERTTCTPAA